MSGAGSGQSRVAASGAESAASGAAAVSQCSRGSGSGARVRGSVRDRVESASASVTVPGSATGSYESPYSSPSTPPPAVEIEDAEFEERPRVASRSGARRSTPPPAYYEDDDDIPDLPGRGWSPLRWLLLIVLVGGLALMVTQWERVARLVGIGSDPALIAAGVAEGDAALAEGHSQAYASAIEAYARAIEAGGDATRKFSPGSPRPTPSRRKRRSTTAEPAKASGASPKQR